MKNVSLWERFVVLLVERLRLDTRTRRKYSVDLCAVGVNLALDLGLDVRGHLRWIANSLVHLRDDLVDWVCRCRGSRTGRCARRAV